MSKRSKKSSKKKTKNKVAKANPYAGFAYGDCHSGPLEVMEIGKATIYAGSKEEVHLYDDWALMLVCGDSFLAPKSKVFFSALAEKLLPASVRKVTVPPYMRIDWMDRQDPGLPSRWWIALAVALRNIEGMVSINCQGGHGRTGTALAILASLSGACPKGKDPVAWVRKVYCEDAVESLVQCEYVESITGEKVKKPKVVTAGYVNITGPNQSAAVPVYGTDFGAAVAAAANFGTGTGVDVPEEQQPVGGEEVVGSEGWWARRTKDW